MTSSSVFTPKVLGISVFMVLTGTINTLAFKFQSLYNYKHGITMTDQMFIGEWLNIFILILPLMFSSKKLERHFTHLHHRASLEKKKTEVSWLRLAFGGFLDAIGSGLATVGLFLVSPSVYQMLYNGSIIFTAIFTIHYLKKPLYRHNWLGVAVLMLGFVVVGLSSIIFGDGDDTESTDVFLNIIGVVLMSLTLIFQGFQYVYEEKILDEVEVDPMRMVTAEGVFGLLTLTLVLFVTANVPCYSDKMCDKDIAFDNPAAALIHMVRDKRVLFYSLMSVFSITFYNLTGLYLTKYVSSIFRIIIDSIRTISVWFFSVIFAFEEFQWDSFGLQLFGFVLLVLGNLIYNEILVIRWCGFDKYIGYKKPNTDPEVLQQEEIDSAMSNHSL